MVLVRQNNQFYIFLFDWKDVMDISLFYKLNNWVSVESVIKSDHH